MELEKIDQSVQERTWVGIEGLEPSQSIKPMNFPPTAICIVVDIDT